MRREIFICKEDLIELYITQKKTTREVAKILDCTQPTIRKFLKLNNIPIRTPGEGLSLVLTGRPLTKEHTAKIAKSNTGKKYGPSKRRNKVKVNCSCCGKEILRRPKYIGKSKHFFCSLECQSKWRKENWPRGKDNKRFKRVETNCKQCNELMIVPPYRLKNAKHGVFCSAECHNLWRSINLVGNKIYNFAGGHKSCYGPGWEKARRDAREQDNDMCCGCGKTKEENGVKKKKLDVHHGVPFRIYRKEMARICGESGIPFELLADVCFRAHNLTNLVSLCVNCHGPIEAQIIKYFKQCDATTIDEMERALKQFPLWQQLKNREFPYYIPNYQI